MLSSTGASTMSFHSANTADGGLEVGYLEFVGIAAVWHFQGDLAGQAHVAGRHTARYMKHDNAGRSCPMLCGSTRCQPVAVPGYCYSRWCRLPGCHNCQGSHCRQLPPSLHWQTGCWDWFPPNWLGWQGLVERVGGIIHQFNVAQARELLLKLKTSCSTPALKAKAWTSTGL